MNDDNKSGFDFNTDNIIVPTYKELPDEERHLLKAQRLEFEKMQLTRYQKTRQHVLKKDTAASFIFTKPKEKSDVGSPPN